MNIIHSIFPKIFSPYKEKIKAGFIESPFYIGESERHTIDQFSIFFKKNPEYKIVQPKQIHTEKIIEINNKLSNHQIYNNKADGVTTTSANIVCSIQTADCISLLIFDPQNKRIGNLHAGWRGLACKIIPEYFKKYKPSQECLVALSPSLGICHSQFSDPYHETPSFFHPFITTDNNIDLWGIAKSQLIASGIQEKNIQMPEFCSQCNPRYWSYRRGDQIKRNMSYIVLQQ